nr:ricin-type beta-trefoil lectin domain protein [Myxococcus sp. CA051A]
MVRGGPPTQSELTTTAPRLAVEENLCSTERFLDEPVLGDCSGVLIDDDLVLTAGHCVTASNACTWKWVFNYYRPSAGTYATISEDDFFACDEIVLRSSPPAPDFAIIRLDRPATPRFTPARVAYGRQAFVTGHEVALIGSPSGLPLKIVSEGVITGGAANDNPSTSLDAMHGNSGSAVYSRNGYTVVGVLHSANGGDDYDPNGTCNVLASWVHAESDFLAMPVILNTLCSKPGFQSDRLCTPLRWHMDGVSPTGVITGGAFDRRNLAHALPIIAVFGAPLEILGGVQVSVTANLPNPSVIRRFGITGDHGFSLTVPAQFHDGLPHPVYFYTVDPVAGTLSGMAGSPIQATVNVPAVVNAAIRGFGDKCLDASWATPVVNGIEIQQWTCLSGAVNQRWTLHPDGSIQGFGGKCLDAAWADPVPNGNKVQIWDCTGGVNQKWTLNPDGSIQGFGGKCLDANWVASLPVPNGNKVQLWDCTGGVNQKWNLYGQSQ